MSADLSSFFQRVQDVKKLQVPADDMPWVERHQTPERSHDVVLYLGCNILRTPHVAQAVTDVFTHLGIDFVAVSGTQYCCGVVWDRAGDVEGGQQVSARTVARVEEYGAPTVVMWCPSCSVHFTDAIYGRDQRTTAFTTTDTPTFLNGLVERGLVPWQRPVPLRVALHAHAGHPDDATGRARALADRTAVARLLRTVPGIEIVEEIDAPPELSFDCGPVATKLGSARFAEIRRPNLTRAESLGVDAIVTISHACQREWCDAASDDLDVVNYISIVAEALGIPAREDTLKRYKAGMDPAAVVNAGRAAWESHGITESEASRLAANYFGAGRQP